MPNYFQIGLVGRFFQFYFLFRHSKNCPRPLVAMFFNGKNDLNNLGRTICAKLFSNRPSLTESMLGAHSNVVDFVMY